LGLSIGRYRKVSFPGARELSGSCMYADERSIRPSRAWRGWPFRIKAVGQLKKGGLNYQIGHHPFPSMPRPNLRQVQGSAACTAYQGYS
jgi:hypothetical protein